MIAPRRFLPSISSLLALEAVARLGSATAAADELSLTHSAVSRQLKVLEEQVGATMFRREGKGLTLTSAGAEYAKSVRDCLHNLARASLKVKADGTRSSLNLATLPAFGMCWLGPRLRDFNVRHPEIMVHIGTRLSPFDFNRDKFDAAIHFGQRDWQGVNYLELVRERVIPACAPTLISGRGLSPDDLLAMPLLHLESRPGAWEEWFEAQGRPADRIQGMLFDQYVPMAEAAALGFGVALLPEFLAQQEFGRGRLVPACGDYLDVTGSYFLVWPSGTGPSHPLDLFLDWIGGQADLPRAG